MAKQTINLGTSANDGTGDPLRDALDKVNDNFDEVYSLANPVTPVSGREILLTDGTRYSAGLTVTPNIIYWSPCFIFREVTITAIGFRITTAAGGQNAQLAIYNAGSDGTPTGSELRATGDLSVATANVYVEAALASNLTLTPGLYFIGANCSGAAAWGSTEAVDLQLFSRFVGLGSAHVGDAGQTGWRSPKTYGTWGDVTSDTFTQLLKEKRQPTVFGVVA
jgi:hypothetical protein